MRVQHDSTTITIPRSAVRKLAERTGQGFRIETDAAKLNIWVPRELEGYDEVKTLLRASTSAEMSTMQYPLALTYAISSITLIAFLITLYSHNRILVTLTGSGVLACTGWYFAYVVRVADITKRDSLICLFSHS